MLDELEKELAIAQTRVAAQRDELRVINEKIVEAQNTLNTVDEKRKKYAHAAAVGDANAAAAMVRIRKECAAAEQDITDLKLALPEAQRRLAEAEQAEKGARLALAKVKADVVIRKRIDAAQRFDDAFREVLAAFNLYMELGGDIENYWAETLAARGYAYTVSNQEALWGTTRILAAMPKPFIRRFFPNAVFSDHSMPLALSERGFWGLPAAEKKQGEAA